jgi:putative oxidoreductase
MTSTAASSSLLRPSKGLHIALWIVQVLIGAAFLMAGLTKATQPMEALATQIPWTAVVGTALTRFIGVSEFLGGLGLILPSLTRIKPVLTPLAGAGLALIMVLAFGFHLVRGEMMALPINAVLGGLAAFVAWGRFKKAPIAPRS